MIEILLGVVVFSGVVLTLSVLILAVRSRLVASGEASIVVNETRTVPARLGSNLLRSLTRAGILIASACGGRGTCGQCKVSVLAGGGAILPTERALISPREEREQVRLACQVTLREDLRVRVPDEVFGVRRWTCRVRSNRSLATFIKELVLDLPGNESLEFRAGGYVMLECPPYRCSFADFDIDPAFRAEWDRYDLWRYRAGTEEVTTRAYSLANCPGERDLVMLNVRIATPPPGASKEVPPGIVSSYIFGLKPGDVVTVSGPYGHFFAREGTREMVFLGGGAGMAPMRSHILDQLQRLKTERTITFWYGARNRKEIFYADLFDGLARSHENFRWFVALSDPGPEDDWEGHTGFIHQVAYDEYLKDHPRPEECEYYVCGPPLMNMAVIRMLEDLGVQREDILLDDFGG